MTPAPWRYTPDHSADFYTKLSEICAWLGCDPLDLLGAMNAESGVSAAAMNPTSSATGLVQFMEMHWRSWGFTRQGFAALPADQQIDFVRRYLAPYRGQLPSAGAVYTAIFLPAFVRAASRPEFILCAKSGQLSWAYEANAAFDVNGDGRITVGELTQAIKRNWRGPRCFEMVQRAGLPTPPWSVPDPTDLRTTYGIQSRLLALGFGVGPSGADGVPGHATRSAVVRFQKARGLPADGMVGPRTRAAMLVDNAPISA